MSLVAPELEDFEAAPADVLARLPAADHRLAPQSPDQVASILAAASASGAGVLPWGGGVHQGLGHRVQPDVVLSTARLARVVDYQPEDLTVVVESGVTVDALEALVGEHGQTAALPETSPAATVGGVIAAGVSGYRRPRYGPTRDRILQTTVATGDGRLVTAGGRVVKNVSGYDIQRSVAGAHGALGVITSVCLKLWPRSSASATVRVADPAEAWSRLYRPLAVLETDRGSSVFLEGPPAQVDRDASTLRGERTSGLDWPTAPSGEVSVAVTIPPSYLVDAVARIRDMGPFVAQHGVGRVDVAGSIDADWPAVRAWAEERGGRLTVTGGPERFYDRVDPWGAEPPGVAVQRRLVAAFDPRRVINPGRLPGPL